MEKILQEKKPRVGGTLGRFLRMTEEFYQKEFGLEVDFNDVGERLNRAGIVYGSQMIIPVPNGITLELALAYFSKITTLKIEENFDLSKIADTRKPDKNYAIIFPGINPCRHSIFCKDVTLLEMLLIKINLYFREKIHFESIIKNGPVFCAGSSIMKGKVSYHPYFAARNQGTGGNLLLFDRSGFLENWRVRVV